MSQGQVLIKIQVCVYVCVVAAVTLLGTVLSPLLPKAFRFIRGARRHLAWPVLYLNLIKPVAFLCCCTTFKVKWALLFGLLSVGAVRGISPATFRLLRSARFVFRETERNAVDKKIRYSSVDRGWFSWIFFCACEFVSRIGVALESQTLPSIEITREI